MKVGLLANPSNSFLIPPNVIGSSKDESRNWLIETRNTKEKLH